MSTRAIPRGTVLGVYTGEVRIEDNQELPSTGGYEDSDYIFNFPIMRTPMTPGNINVNPKTRA
jgi:hypothetical protein